MRSRSGIEGVDVAAATFVVGTDLIECDFLTLEDAMANLPQSRGKIFILGGTFSLLTKQSLPNGPIRFEGSGEDSTIIDASGADFTIFESAFNIQYEFTDMTVLGSGHVGSLFFAAKAGSGATPGFIGERLTVTGVEKCLYAPTGCAVFATIEHCVWKVADLASSFHGDTVDPATGTIDASDSVLTSVGGGTRGGIGAPRLLAAGVVRLVTAGAVYKIRSRPV